MRFPEPADPATWLRFRPLIRDLDPALRDDVIRMVQHWVPLA